MKPYTDDLAALRDAGYIAEPGPQADNHRQFERRLKLASIERLERLIELIEQRLWLPIAVPAQPAMPMPPVSVSGDGTGNPPPGPLPSRTDEVPR